MGLVNGPRIMCCFGVGVVSQCGHCCFVSVCMGAGGVERCQIKQGKGGGGQPKSVVIADQAYILLIKHINHVAQLAGHDAHLRDAGKAPWHSCSLVLSSSKVNGDICFYTPQQLGVLLVDCVSATGCICQVVSGLNVWLTSTDTDGGRGKVTISHSMSHLQVWLQVMFLCGHLGWGDFADVIFVVCLMLYQLVGSAFTEQALWP